FVGIERVAPFAPGVFDQQRLLLPVVAEEYFGIEGLEFEHGGHWMLVRRWRRGFAKPSVTGCHRRCLESDPCAQRNAMDTGCIYGVFAKSLRHRHGALRSPALAPPHCQCSWQASAPAVRPWRRPEYRATPRNAGSPPG